MALLDDTYRAFALAHRDASTLPTLTFLADDLTDSTYVANPDHTFIDVGGASDPVDAELSGTGYARQTLANKTLVVDNTLDRSKFDADDVTFVGLDAGTAAGAILFKSTGVATTSLMIAYINDGFPYVSQGLDFTLRWNTNGILNGV